MVIYTYFLSLLMATGLFCFYPNRSVQNARLITGHIQILQELKKRFLEQLSKKQTNLDVDIATPTMSHMKAMQELAEKYPEYKTANDSITKDRIAYTNLVYEVVQKEREYNDSHYVFYHAQQSCFNIVRDFIKEIYAMSELMHLGNDFQFLRNWLTAPEYFNTFFFLGFTPANVYDHDPELVKKLLSVNLSLFGNRRSKGEDTFHYFKENNNVHPPQIIDLLTEIFNLFDFNSMYLDELVQLNTLLETHEGALLQIFIPKEQVDNYVYISHAFGVPYRDPLVEEIYDNRLERHTRIAPILEKYKNDPLSLGIAGDFDELQARILLSKDLLLDPHKGVKIFTYLTTSKEQQEKYHQELKKLVVRIFAERLAAKPEGNILHTRLGKLLQHLALKA